MTERLQKAIDFMKVAHRSIGQMRRDGKRHYEVHPMEVMGRLVGIVKDEDILIAGLLHDVIEDVFPANPYYDLYLIANTFGNEVAELVKQLTDEFTKEGYPDKNRKARKQLERERYKTMSTKAKLIKLADIASNLSDDGGGDDPGFMRMYIKEKQLCLPYLAMPYADRDKPFYAANDTLFREAVKILDAQKIKFDVR